MHRSSALAITPFLIAICCICADACTTTYVRVPAVCPRDPQCLDDRPDGGAEARTREADFVRRHEASTVIVRGTRYFPNVGARTTAGIGALVGSKRYVLTAFHLVDGAENVTVVLRTASPDGGAAEGREIPAIPLVLSRDEDLALLALPESERLPPSLPVRYGPVIKDDVVLFIGAAGGVRRGKVIAAGVSAGINSSFAYAAVASAPGDAGAPVMNACGEIVGTAIGPYGPHGTLRFVPVDRALSSLSVTPSDLR